MIMQIGPDNLHFAAIALSEVFGHENHVATIPYVTSTNQSTAMIPEIGNWLIWFARQRRETKPANYRPQTSSAISTTRASLRFWSSSVTALPCQVLEKPHCGLRQTFSGST